MAESQPHSRAVRARARLKRRRIVTHDVFPLEVKKKRIHPFAPCRPNSGGAAISESHEGGNSCSPIRSVVFVERLTHNTASVHVGARSNPGTNSASAVGRKT